MSIELNHTIVHVRDNVESSNFLAEIMGLESPTPFGHFLVVRTSNNVSLDFHTSTEKIRTQHYAFLVSESEFDQIFGRIKDRGLKYWADPNKSKPSEINTHDGGRGIYFDDPSGHILEIITRPYGG